MRWPARDELRLRLYERDRDADVRLEERVDKLPLLEVLGLDVDAPNVVGRAVDDVQRREDRRPHRMVLVVVPMQAVAAARLKIFEPLEVAANRLDSVLVDRVVHRVCLS